MKFRMSRRLALLKDGFSGSRDAGFSSGCCPPARLLAQRSICGFGRVASIRSRIVRSSSAPSRGDAVGHDQFERAAVLHQRPLQLILLLELARVSMCSRGASLRASRLIL